MSKEFELQQDPRDVAVQEAYVDALTGLPTMSQFASRERCEEARLKHMFVAGRALGRREVKGELGRVVDFLEGQSRRGEIVTANTFRAAIEAIPEEAQ